MKYKKKKYSLRQRNTSYNELRLNCAYRWISVCILLSMRNWPFSLFSQQKRLQELVVRRTRIYILNFERNKNFYCLEKNEKRRFLLERVSTFYYIFMFRFNSAELDKKVLHNEWISKVLKLRILNSCLIGKTNEFAFVQITD